MRAVEDYHVDRPGVYVQQCTELTGPNRSIGLIAKHSFHVWKKVQTSLLQTRSRVFCISTASASPARFALISTKFNWCLTTHPFFAGLVVLAEEFYPIPFRTRPSKPPAPMVLRLKPRESRSLPVLLRTDAVRTRERKYKNAFTTKKALREKSRRAFCFRHDSAGRSLHARFRF